MKQKALVIGSLNVDARIRGALARIELGLDQRANDEAKRSARVLAYHHRSLGQLWGHLGRELLASVPASTGD